MCSVVRRRRRGGSASRGVHGIATRIRWTAPYRLPTGSCRPFRDIQPLRRERPCRPICRRSTGQARRPLSASFETYHLATGDRMVSAKPLHPDLRSFPWPPAIRDPLAMSHFRSLVWPRGLERLRRPMALRDHLVKAANISSGKNHPYLVSFGQTGLVARDPLCPQIDLRLFVFREEGLPREATQRSALRASDSRRTTDGGFPNQR